MNSALYGRIEGSLTALPPPYALHRVMLARAASAEVRSPARAPSFSVAWCENDTVPEIINATTGKLESGQPSLLCKQSMFARWQYLVKRLPLLPQSTECTTVTPTLPQLDGLLYQEAKQLSPGYQLAKQRLIEAFDKAKLGKWVKKPLEQDQFICELTDADPELLFA
ncbi:hypothetical protein JYU34_018136 [Plutella xylostella]|uniref:A to I editase domain-containing protein n=1 Tax=Plutella xylostella TaxID=51655 RepID=A0ABQ7PZU5_PLUXY|nr:hypothetical protein JYU34_018136 [Plutella xylostella]